MKQILLIFMAVALVGCGTTSWVSDPSDPNSVKIEGEIRRAAKKPTGELTKANLENVKDLHFRGDKLTDVKGLEKLTQLKKLSLSSNPDLTKAKIVQLQKALPKCKITYDKSTK